MELDGFPDLVSRSEVMDFLMFRRERRGDRKEDHAEAEDAAFRSVRDSFDVLDNERPLLQSLALRVVGIHVDEAGSSEDKKAVAADAVSMGSAGKGLAPGGTREGCDQVAAAMVKAGCRHNSSYRPPREQFLMLILPEVEFQSSREGQAPVVSGTIIRERSIWSTNDAALPPTLSEISEGRFALDLEHPTEMLVSFPQTHGLMSLSVFEIGRRGIWSKKCCFLQREAVTSPRISLEASIRSWLTAKRVCHECVIRKQACDCLNAGAGAKMIASGPKRHPTWSKLREFYYSLPDSISMIRFSHSSQCGSSKSWVTQDSWSNGRGCHDCDIRLASLYLRHSPPTLMIISKEAKDSSDAYIMSNATPGSCDQSASKIYCGICGKGFYRKSRLKIHIAVSHEGAKLFECTTCDKSYHSQANLNRHDRMVHQKVHRFFCPLCNRGFYSNRDCRRHEAVCCKASSHPFPSRTVQDIVSGEEKATGDSSLHSITSLGAYRYADTTGIILSPMCSWNSNTFS